MQWWQVALISAAATTVVIFGGSALFVVFVLPRIFPRILRYLTVRNARQVISAQTAHTATDDDTDTIDRQSPDYWG